MTSGEVASEKKAQLQDLIARIFKLTQEGERDIDQVLEVLQLIESRPDFGKILLERREAAELVRALRDKELFWSTPSIDTRDPKG